MADTATHSGQMKTTYPTAKRKKKRRVKKVKSSLTPARLRVRKY